MQYQQFLKRSQRVDFGSHPLNFHSYFQGHFLFDNPKTPFPTANLQSQSEPHLPNKRERYLYWLNARFIFFQLYNIGCPL
jgi:hypothetical protein